MRQGAGSFVSDVTRKKKKRAKLPGEKDDFPDFQSHDENELFGRLYSQKNVKSREKERERSEKEEQKVLSVL